MHAQELADELWPQLRQIAQVRGLQKVIRVEMTVGAMHKVQVAPLCEYFKQYFRGTNFQSAVLTVSTVAAGQMFSPPGADEPIPASGWEILITTLDGSE